MKLLAYALVGLVALPLLALSAARGGTALASDGIPTLAALGEPKATGKGGSLGGDNGSSFRSDVLTRARDAQGAKKAFVGIIVRTVRPAKAKELGISGGAVVLRVFKDGPSAGILRKGDVITAIEGKDVADARDLGDVVRAAAPGDVLTFTVIRDGKSVIADVTAEGRQLRAKRHPAGGLTPLPGLPGRLRGVGKNLVKAEIVVKSDEGLKTFTAVTGTMSQIDADSGTFTLAPADGSSPVTYTIGADTRVITLGKGNLGGLNTVDKTVVFSVVDKKGKQVRLVLQGEPPLRGPSFGAPGLGEGFHGRFQRLKAFPTSPPSRGSEGGQASPRS